LSSLVRHKGRVERVARSASAPPCCVCRKSRRCRHLQKPQADAERQGVCSRRSSRSPRVGGKAERWSSSARPGQDSTQVSQRGHVLSSGLWRWARHPRL